jgi:hypothetical protein
MINPCINEILKFSYEFELSVARPEEPADWFTERIYVPTLLDEELLPDILSDRFELVLVTGNPGDGKSAFMRQLMPSGGHSTTSGRPIHVLHDATQPRDAGDRSASALDDLITFLGPFTDAGWDPAEARSQVHVVGINKGLLVRAFASENSPFGRLRACFRDEAKGKTSDVDGLQIRVVDLNDRSEVTYGQIADESLFDRILDKLVSSENWEDQACGECRDTEWCPFLANARVLRDDPARTSLRLLWLVQQLEGERHTTLRDILAGLSYTLVGHEDMFHEQGDPSKPLVHPCDFVAFEKAIGSFGPLLSRLIYNSCFVDFELLSPEVRDILGAGASEISTAYGMAPTILREDLGLLDPAKSMATQKWDEVEGKVVKNPRRYLASLKKTAATLGIGIEIALSEAADSALDRFDEDLDEYEPSQSEYRQSLASHDLLVQFLVETAKRRAFMFSGETSPTEMTPYAGLRIFLSAIEYGNSGNPELINDYDAVLRDIIPAAVHNAERVPNPQNTDEFRVRWSASRGQSSVGAVLVLRSDGAEIQVGPEPDKYLEYYPQYLLYKPGLPEQGTTGLRLSLKTFEGIYQISKGYSDEFAGVPRTHQFLNFRHTLRGSPPRRLLIVDEADPTLQVSVTSDSHRMRFE